MINGDLIASQLSAYPDLKRLFVAYSGGVDSHVLLHVIAQRLPGGMDVEAIYINHGLQQQSAAWVDHCHEICRNLDIVCRTMAVDASAKDGESPEQAARRARYAAFQAVIKSSDALLTAHHQDDQAETLLLQLLRGAGPQGLAAMPLAARFGQGLLLRLLLNHSRADIMRYARDYNLHWIEDSSNNDQRFDRNYLRHTVLPGLRQRWPALERTLSRSATLCAEAVQLNAELAQQDWQSVNPASSAVLPIDSLLTFNESRLRNLLRYWLSKLLLPTPSLQQLQGVIQELIIRRASSQAIISWPGCEIRRYQNHLYAQARQPLSSVAEVYQWPDRQPLTIAGIGTLSLQQSNGQGFLQVALMGELSVRFRRGGERLRPSGQLHTRPLKKLLQEAGIPPWRRDRLPLLFLNDRLIAVADLFISADLAAREGEQSLIFAWQKVSDSVKV